MIDISVACEREQQYTFITNLLVKFQVMFDQEGIK